MKPISILTRGAMAALTLLFAGTTACTDSHGPLNPDQGTQPSGGVTSVIAPKPGYTSLPAASRTTIDGSWQTGDQVLAKITFYTDDKGTNPAHVVEQALTLTALGSWTAAPAIAPIAPSARSMRVQYSYIGKPEPLTASHERIGGYATQAKGTAIYHDKPDDAFTADQANGYLIPITSISGTLTLSVTFERRSALVIVALQPGQEVELTTPYLQDYGSPQADGTYLFRAHNTTTAAATAYFHLQAPRTTEADAAPFTLRLANEQNTVYKGVPMRGGWKYALDAQKISSGAGGENQQFVTASGLKPLDPNVFNAKNPVWIITGGDGKSTTDATVCGNVKVALDALPEGSNIELTMTGVKTVGTQAFERCQALGTVSLPVAENIGVYAFKSCEKLTTISMPAVTSIGEITFSNCFALKSISLPAVTSIGEMAFHGCGALTYLELSAAGSITLAADVFNAIYTTDKCTLVLNADKANGGTATPKVAADGKKWGPAGKELTWKAIEYLGTPTPPPTPTPTPSTGLPGVGDGGSSW